ncbi:TIGR04222 domain-containing membrane protein [Blastococcus sp. SYSU DS0619]
MRTADGTADLDVYDIAALAGGLPRLVDTALVALVESGRIRIHAPGELAATDPLRRHPVEAAVLDAVGTRGHRSVDTIRWRLDGDERLLEVSRRLRQHGLARRVPFRAGADAPTAAGRRLLRRWAADTPPDPAADGGSAASVALHGRAAMPDRRLCAEIFERTQSALAPARGRRGRGVDHSDPKLAAYRARGAVGGAGGYALVEGSGIDGGGL